MGATREWHREYRRKHRENQRAQGLCLHCKSLVVDGRSMCQRHIDTTNLAAARYRGKQMDGLCRRCRISVSLGRMTCDRCYTVTRRAVALKICHRRLAARIVASGSHVIDIAASRYESGLPPEWDCVPTQGPRPDTADGDTRAAVWACGASRGKLLAVR